MPAGILIGLVNWLASHLVFFTLLGFVAAGLIVFDVVDVGPLVTGRQAAQPQAVDVADQTDARPHVADSSPPVAPLRPARPMAAVAPEQPAKPTEVQPQATKGPKLIGGSLPVYAELPRNGASASRTDVDGFRPPAELGTSTPSTLGYSGQIQRARQAFWNGDFEGAEARYMDVIEAYPDDPDAFGELGNLYESMAKPQLARDAYYAAGVRLRAGGDREKLRQVIDLLIEKGDKRVQTLAEQ